MCSESQKMVRIVLICLCLVLGLTTIGRSGGDQGAEVSIQPAWKVGETRRYERVKTRRQIVGGKTMASGTARAPIDVSILEAGKDGFLIRWRIGGTTFDDPKVTVNPLTRAMIKLVEGIEFHIELDAEATITGVRNWSELKTKAAKITDTLLNPQHLGTDAKTVAAIRPTIEAMFATKERIEQAFTVEPQMFFLPVGRTYPAIDQPINYDAELPNLLGGAPCPCKGSIRLMSYDPAKGRAKVAWRQVPDPKASARNIHEILNGLGQRLGQTPAKADELGPLSMEDRAEFVLDGKTGWVEEFTHTRSVTIEGNTRQDILSMTRQIPSE